MNPQDERLSRARDLWRRDGLKASSVANYVQWVQRFTIDCAQVGKNPDTQLTRQSVELFTTRYVLRRGVEPVCARHNVKVALRAWSRASAVLGYAVPPWSDAKPAPHQPPLLAAFADHQGRHRGLRETSIAKQCVHITAFLAFLHRRRRGLNRMGLGDIDAFVVERRQRYSIAEVADACSSLRVFLRFLHASGRTRVDLAPSVQAPCLQRGARPPRALPWTSVVRLLRAVDRTSRVGRRDYAMLLLMATYGMGGSEVCSICLDDIDWRAGTLRLTRPKTGIPSVLPLLPQIARALVGYLRNARPRSTQSRHLFVTMTGAHTPLVSSAIRHIVRKHARAAGLPLDGLGSHTLRHSHATRQVNDGAAVPVVSDILGHRSTTVMSTYARVAVDRLRAIALPVPSW